MTVNEKLDEYMTEQKDRYHYWLNYINVRDKDDIRIDGSYTLQNLKDIIEIIEKYDSPQNVYHI